MRRVLTWCLVASSFAMAADSGAKPEYFKYSRKVLGARSAAQNFVVVDRVMWEHMRPDLGDMRLYVQGNEEIPYALTVQRGGRSLTQDETKLLDLGEGGGRTEFKLQVSANEYDAITLRLKAKNFNTVAQIEGSDDSKTWTKLGKASIFDFSDERLGNNSEIRLPAAARFPFLRISLDGAVRAKDVEGATVAILKDRDSAWLTIPAEPARAERERNTIFEWDGTATPVERVQVLVDDPALNFYRSAELLDPDGHVIASTELSRVHVRRDHTMVDHENLALDLPYPATAKHYKLVIHNGDDRALPIKAVRVLSYERRVYFQPRQASDLVLYFGDEKSVPPVYDYARLFREDASAVKVELEASTANARYSGRPDDRPWSERNRWVLWVALVFAVVALGFVALRGLKANS